MLKKSLNSLVLIGILFSCLFSHNFSLAQTKNIKINLKTTICGDGIVGGNEECEFGYLSGKTCQSFGFALGTLKCHPSCNFDITDCHQPYLTPSPLVADLSQATVSSNLVNIISQFDPDGNGIIELPEVPPPIFYLVFYLSRFTQIL